MNVLTNITASAKWFQNPACASQPPFISRISSRTLDMLLPAWSAEGRSFMEMVSMALLQFDRLVARGSFSWRTKSHATYPPLFSRLDKSFSHPDGKVLENIYYIFSGNFSFGQVVSHNAIWNKGYMIVTVRTKAWICEAAAPIGIVWCMSKDHHSSSMQLGPMLVLQQFSVPSSEDRSWHYLQRCLHQIDIFKVAPVVWFVCLIIGIQRLMPLR